MFWRFELLRMPTCLQCLNLVPRRKLRLVNQPSDASSQSDTNVMWRLQVLVTMCLHWYFLKVKPFKCKACPYSAGEFTGGLTARLHLDVSLQGCCSGCILASSPKYSYPLAVHFYTGIFTTHKCFNDPFLNGWNWRLAFERDLTNILSLKPHKISFPSCCPVTLVAHFHPVIPSLFLVLF